MSARTKHARKSRETSKAQRERARILEAFESFVERTPERWAADYGRRIVRASLNAQSYPLASEGR